jgi:hypothetical protein
VPQPPHPSAAPCRGVGAARVALVALVALGACGRDRGPAAPAAPPARAANAPDGVGAAPGASAVDSVIPRAEEMRRFTADLGPAPVALSGGERSRDALVRRFVQALERRDTANLRRMHLTRAEFAYLYYPSAPVSRPPYDLSPGLFWFQLDGNSNRGIARALAERGGRPLGYAGVDCATPVTEGENRVHARCVIHHTGAGGRDEMLFGSILERGGRFKFISYANKL